MTEAVLTPILNATGKPVERILAMVDDRGLVSASVHFGNYRFDETRVMFQAEAGVHYQLAPESLDGEEVPMISLLWDEENNQAVFGRGKAAPWVRCVLKVDGGYLAELELGGGLTVLGVGTNRSPAVP